MKQPPVHEEILFLAMVALEVQTARAHYPPMNSLHEGYAVILEEIEEFWDEVKHKPSERDPRRMRDELIQIAAMCLRTAEDCGLMRPTV